MTDIILVFIIGAIVGLASGYLRKARKKGVKCVGCPDSGSCSGNCSGCGCECAARTDGSTSRQ